MKFKVRVHDEEKEIEITRRGNRLQVRYGEQTADARLIYTEGAHFVLEVEEEEEGGFVRRRRIRAAGYHDGQDRQLWANGRLVYYKRLREGAAAAASEASSLSASIPAVVSEILVSVGDEVSAGQRLLLLESMKMILPIQAPYSGRVTAVHCAVGEAVQPGIQLIEIEGPEE